MTSSDFYQCPHCRCFRSAAPDTLCPQCEIDKARGYESRSLTGRCANGAERDSGTLYHALPLPGSPMYIEGKGYRAVCGAEPGRRSVGWGWDNVNNVTCPRCLRRLEKAGVK